MIIKTTNSEILADFDLIRVEQIESKTGVFGYTGSKNKVLLGLFETLEQAKQLVNNIYQLTPNALSLDPNDIPQNEVEIS